MNSGVTGSDQQGVNFSCMYYEDDPKASLAYLKGLSKPQLNNYVQGYMHACVHMREALTRAKIILLNQVLDGEAGAIDGVHLLDKYEQLVKDREENLYALFPDILG